MHSSLSSPSLCLSLISAVVVALAAGCGDDANCGTGGAPTEGLVAAAGGHSIPYGALTSLAANDCPDPTDATAPTSVTIEGSQVMGSGLITLCIPRPDQLSDGPRTLGNRLSGGGDILIEDLFGTIDGCTYTQMSSVPPTGSATATGACDNATNPAGFALAFAGTVTAKQTCGTAPETMVVLNLTGSIAVTLRP